MICLFNDAPQRVRGRERQGGTEIVKLKPGFTSYFWAADLFGNCGNSGDSHEPIGAPQHLHHSLSPSGGFTCTTLRGKWVCKLRRALNSSTKKILELIPPRVHSGFKLDTVRYDVRTNYKKITLLFLSALLYEEKHFQGFSAWLGLELISRKGIAL